MPGLLRRLALAGAGAVTVAALAPTAAWAAPHSAARPAYRQACGAAGVGHARCLAVYRAASTSTASTSTASTSRAPTDAAPPAGYGPADLRSAYALPVTTTAGGTVAVVLAFDYPSAEADLATYRSSFGLPPCTSAKGCFRKVNGAGAAAPLPDPDSGWALEAALDLQMASTGCPTCRLLLVEADDATLDLLAAGVNTAVRLGAAVVSNSYGSDENGAFLAVESAYNHPGVPILASSGDAGFTAASVPAVAPGVISVGGTSLVRAADERGWSEQAWSGAGSGCSAWYDKPAWQHDPNCQMRTSSDISADADPATGVAVYDTFGSLTPDGWLVVGGTSVSSPFLAGVIASTGHPERVTAASLYGQPASAFYDAVGGSNGFCGGDYLCTGLPGYDAPTGLGTPRGLAPFS